MDVTRAPLRAPSTSSSGTAGAWPVDRPAVPGRLRLPAATRDAGRATPTRSASPCSRPTSCATSARTSATAGSTCPQRGPRRVRREAARSTTRGALVDTDGALAALIRCERRAGPGLVRRRAAAAAAAGPAQRRLRRRDGRHLPPAAGPDRSRAAGGLRPPAVAARLAEGRGRAAARAAGARAGADDAERGSSSSAAAWPASPPRCACADAGAEVTLLEAATAARRADLLVPARRAGRRQRPARVPALLRGLPGAAGPARSHRPAALQDRLDIPVLRAGRGGPARLRRAALPAPLHLARRCSRYRLLRPAERLRAVRGALALRRVDRADPARDTVQLRRLAGRARQDARTVAALWDLVGVATLNAAPTSASLALAAMVFQIGLLERRRTPPTSAGRGCRCGELHGDAARDARWPRPASGAAPAPGRRALEPTARAGGRRRHRTSGRGRPRRPGRAAAGSAEALLPPRRGRRRAGGWARGWAASPIVNVHVVLRPAGASTEPFFAARRLARCSGSSTAPRQSGLGSGPVPGGVAVRGRRLHRRAGRRSCAELLPELAALLPAAARGARCWTSSSPGSARRRSGRRRAAAALRPPAPTRRARVCAWPGRGPTPAGRRRWRARCAAASRRPTPCSARRRPRCDAEAGDSDRRPCRRHRCATRASSSPALRAAVDRLDPHQPRRSRAYHFGWCDVAGRRPTRRRRQGGAARAGAAVRPGRRRAAPRSGCPARSPSSWCTTSRCCTTT